MPAHAWSDLPKALGGADILSKVNSAFTSDPQYLAFTTTDAITAPITFGIKAAGSDNAILVHVGNSKGSAKAGPAKEAAFTLSALPEQWEQFFQQVPKPPYQSYWGMFGMNIRQEGIEVLGNQDSFAHYTHVWRRVLELLHDAKCGPTPEDTAAAKGGYDEADVDHLTGRYIYVTAPLWGKCKVFVESAGNGRQPILFLHTAGADSRQYHGVMNDARMREKCTMYAFDLPGHGRSFPSTEYFPGGHTNTEDSYVGCITAVIKKLRLNAPIVCGASMAGQVCLAVAIRCEEVGAGGVIPLQGSEYLNMQRQWNDRSPYVNQSLFNPEWVYGMMAPTTPLSTKRLIWHLYSAQAYGIFHGDLDFYFGGWDGRTRVSKIDTAKCPVYMLTGEYDWSNTPEMSQKTADKIKGAMHKSMPGLGHFPATEKPATFVGHLLEAIEHIQKERRKDLSLLRMTDD
ncbi:alpha/beta-hydrolase [Saccharata proteae CBS 121410]|uniref:Alpha/beta-hydrolase n=1 Tax=Saccharata proteae CBS 121410 TaxID=1314787 RepID=A0A9P4LW90_9PEZI|nr:alpha/beta-hydrolase [Saccharata proteae CBS 121410]